MINVYTAFYRKLITKLLNLHQEYTILELDIHYCSIHSVVICYVFKSVAIAADRYFKVSRPMQYLRLVTKRTCAVVVALMWCLALSCWIFLYAMVQNNDVGEKATVQILLSDFSYSYMSIIIINMTLLPCIITTFCFIYQQGQNFKTHPLISITCYEANTARQRFVSLPICLLLSLLDFLFTLLYTLVSTINLISTNLLLFQLVL